MIDTDTIKTRNDIVEVVGTRIDLKKQGREYVACCPFHHEKTPSFTVSQGKQFYHCFGCGAHGDVIAFIQEYERVDFQEAIAQLGGDTPMVQRHRQPDFRPRWRWLRSLVFGVIVEHEEFRSERANRLADNLLPDLHRLHKKVGERASGKALPLTPRERGVVNVIARCRPQYRNRIRGMYGMG